MKNLIYIISTLFLLTFSISAQTASNTETVLHIEVENGKTIDLKPADLAQLPRLSVKAKDHDGKDMNFEGIALREVLQLADIKFGKEFDHVNLNRYLKITAKDNYSVVFAFAEIDPAFTDKIILLADKSEGKMLDEKYGYWQIIVPDEKKHGRWIRQVVKLSVKSVNP